MIHIPHAPPTHVLAIVSYFVNRVCFIDAALGIASASSDGTVKLWKMPAYVRALLAVPPPASAAPPIEAPAAPPVPVAAPVVTEAASGATSGAYVGGGGRGGGGKAGTSTSPRDEMSLCDSAFFGSTCCNWCCSHRLSVWCDVPCSCSCLQMQAAALRLLSLVYLPSPQVHRVQRQGRVELHLRPPPHDSRRQLVYSRPCPHAWTPWPHLQVSGVQIPAVLVDSRRLPVPSARRARNQRPLPSSPHESTPLSVTTCGFVTCGRLRLPGLIVATKHVARAPPKAPAMAHGACVCHIVSRVRERESVTFSRRDGDSHFAPVADCVIARKARGGCVSLCEFVCVCVRVCVRASMRRLGSGSQTGAQAAWLSSLLALTTASSCGGRRVLSESACFLSPAPSTITITALALCTCLSCCTNYYHSPCCCVRDA